MPTRVSTRPRALAPALLAGLALAAVITAPAQTGGRPSPAPRPGITVNPSTPVIKTSSPLARPNFLSLLLPLGDRMASYLQAQVNARRRIGGGGCAHLATEALRVAGAEFRRPEPPGTVDHVWTSNRVARLTHGSQLASARFQVGDIIQYHNATFSDRGPIAHHTQVVAAVGQGRLLQVFEQNVSGNRTALRKAPHDLKKLTGGSVSVYRPVRRATRPGRVEFTLVNNTNASRTYLLQIGSNPTSATLGAANTDASYQQRWATFSGNARPTLKVGNTALVIEDGAAYELYSPPGGQVGLRKM